MKIKRSIYNILKKLALYFGFNLRILRIPTDGTDYEGINTYATYAPWLSDIEFNTTHEAVKKYTKVDKYRLYSLWQLVEQTAHLKGALLEVGVWRGGSGALIAKKAQLLGMTEIVYLCDTFEGIVKAGDKDSNYFGGELWNTSEAIVELILKGLSIDWRIVLKGTFPEDTGSKIMDDKIRFCHIDVDVYQSAKDTFEWLWSRLVTGGIVVFDDYGFKGCEGVTTYVNEIKDLPGRVFIHNLNGQGIIVKTEG